MELENEYEKLRERERERVVELEREKEEDEEKEIEWEEEIEMAREREIGKLAKRKEEILKEMIELNERRKKIDSNLRFRSFSSSTYKSNSKNSLCFSFFFFILNFKL
jgi:hypothetical protein